MNIIRDIMLRAEMPNECCESTNNYRRAVEKVSQTHDVAVCATEYSIPTIITRAPPIICNFLLFTASTAGHFVSPLFIDFFRRGYSQKG